MRWRGKDRGTDTDRAAVTRPMSRGGGSDAAGEQSTIQPSPAFRIRIQTVC